MKMLYLSSPHSLSEQNTGLQMFKMDNDLHPKGESAVAAALK